jgi:uncharacterized protein (UPF0333 family)
VSLEFIILLSAIVVFAFGMLAVVGYYNKMEIDSKSDTSIINLLDYVENEIILATKMKEGYIKRFEIPEKINAENYIIHVNETNILLQFDNRFFVRVIPKINGDFIFTKNVIKKTNEEVYLN